MTQGSDCYRWIDPLEEIEAARDNERQRVAAAFEHYNEPLYRSLLHRELQHLAQRTAHDTIRHMGLEKLLAKTAGEMLELAVRQQMDAVMHGMGAGLRVYLREDGEGLAVDLVSTEAFYTPAQTVRLDRPGTPQDAL
ncbi:hypothetical protein [Phenylobacterium sp.]|uniref:hypothetical protein n=1 Tax=Phenylobacterium sp. TaxID=1871053 RepID=UPI002FCBE6C0